MPRPSLSLPEPPWWSAWRAIAAARLRPGRNPFSIAHTDGTLAGFVLPEALRYRQPHMTWAQGFVEALAQIQTARQVSIAYAEDINCADLQSGHILLDASIISPCPFRKQATFTERLDILGGLCVHELLHLDYSSVELCRQSKERGPLFAHTYNILEDEYIESQLPQTSPGYADYVLAARRYMFDDAHRAVVQHDTSLLNVFLLFVRYPQRLHWQDIAQYGAELAHISHLLTPFPASSAAVYHAAEQIVAVFQRGQHSVPEPTEQLSAFLEATAHHRLTEADGLTPMVEAMLRRQISRRSKRSSVSNLSESEWHSQGAVVWETPRDDRQQYEQDRRTVRPYIQRLRRWLHGWDAPAVHRRTGRSRGHLDHSQLHTIPLGNERLFQGQRRPESRRLTFVLVIDESGSMDGEKIAAARQVAILYKEALAPLRHVELYIFGHSADQPSATTTLFRYWAPGWPQQYSLGRVSAKNNNRDGVALWVVAQEVKRRTRNRDIIVLVLSDGQPYAHGYEGDAAVAHTRTTVKRLQRDMTVIQVAIDPGLDSARMFDHYVRFTALATLPAAMMRLLHKLLM